MARRLCDRDYKCSARRSAGVSAATATPIYPPASAEPRRAASSCAELPTSTLQYYTPKKPTHAALQVLTYRALQTWKKKKIKSASVGVFFSRLTES